MRRRSVNQPPPQSASGCRGNPCDDERLECDDPIARAARLEGDPHVLDTLLVQHRARLRRMIAGAARSAAPQSDRPFGRDPGSLSGGLGAADELPPISRDALLLMAPVSHRAEVDHVAPASSGGPDEGRRPGGDVPPRQRFPKPLPPRWRPISSTMALDPAKPRFEPRGRSKSGKRPEEMAPLDREVLAMRHFEQLSRG